MIIVEGCDNTGKTSLVSKLAKDIGLVSIKSERLPQSINDIIVWTIDMCQLSSRYPVIFDRWIPISEPVYGPICRNIELLPYIDRIEVYKYMVQYMPVVVYCRPQDEMIKELEKDEMKGVKENIDKIILSYDSILKELQEYFYVLIYDYEISNYEQLKTDILDYFGRTLQ